jgi:ribosomal-protein-alanine N-acetyltransferase
LENVAVGEPSRRRGLGRQLVAALADAARQQHARAIFLEVRESNAAARALYRASGFQESGRRSGYYSCPTEDAILYTLAVQ